MVCGEGDLRPALEQRIRELGVDDAVELRGYVPHDEGLAETYRKAHALAHVTWTEGLPQILYEAFAARLPVVATDVGGIREAVGDAALLVPAGRPTTRPSSSPGWARMRSFAANWSNEVSRWSGPTRWSPRRSERPSSSRSNPAFRSSALGPTLKVTAIP